MSRYLTAVLALSLIALPAQANFYNSSGNDGRDGSSGRPGRDGSSGTSQTIMPTGNAATIDLSGQPGEAGDHGRDGERPLCVYDRYDRGNHRDRDNDRHGISRNITEANGGNGGQGGQGGQGGNAGNLTLYYTNLSDLRNILVRANGGQGGRGGRGGYGANGCRCPRNYWTVKTCTGTGKDRKCKETSYSCTDGRDGRNGGDGLDGRIGATGQLTLINRSTLLPTDVPTQTATLEAWQQQPIELSQNRWATTTGANNLFAPGSTIADRYTLLEERVERTVKLQWQAPEAFSNFAKLPIKFAIDEQKRAQVILPEDMWAQTTWQQSENAAILTVNQVMYRQDALKLGVVGLRGSGQKLTIKLLDVALQTGRVNTGAIQLQYRVKQNDGSFKTYFAGEVPAALVNSRANEFVLSLGQLPIEPAVLAAGTTVDLAMRVNRSFGSNNTDQVILWQGVIGALPAK
jgi:hypothetical protein